MSDDNSIKNKVLKNLGQIVAETGKEIVKESINITEKVISPRELLGGIKPLSEQEIQQKRYDDEKKKQEEIAKLKNIPGHDLEREVSELVQKNKQEEDEKEKQMLEKVRMQREQERREREAMVAEVETQNLRHKKKRRKEGRKKASPDDEQTSQTGEFKSGKME